MWVFGLPVAALVLKRTLRQDRKRRTSRKRIESIVLCESDDDEKVLARFYEVYELVEKTMSTDDVSGVNEAIGLLENFLCHCKEEEGRPLRHLMTLILTLRNCAHGHSNEFPSNSIDMIWNTTSELMFECIERAARSKRQSKYAIRAAEELLEALGDDMVSCSATPAEDPELGGVMYG